MTTVLILIIYLAFISLGLPDAVFGSAWPIIHQDIGVSITAAGYLTTVIAIGTVLSSLFSVRLIHKFGTGKITLVSVILTACGLAGIGQSPGFIWICLMAVPLGLGAGAIDAAAGGSVI